MEDFVDFALAKKLKEKGFNNECHAYYEPLKHCLNLSRTFKTNSIAEHYKCITAPTISQVLKWLREEKRIVFGITPMQEMDCDYLGWCITIYKVADDGYGLSWQEELYYDSYESVALAGIEYVLDNLI